MKLLNILFIGSVLLSINLKGDYHFSLLGQKECAKLQTHECTVRIECVFEQIVNLTTQAKKQIQETRIKASFAVNKELIKLYWFVGKIIDEMQQESEWGSRFIDSIAQELQDKFSNIKGFSRSNIYYMRSFFDAYKKLEQLTEFFDLPIFNLPWGHNIILLTKLEDNESRLWYAKKAIEHGWSRSVLDFWIESALHTREGETQIMKSLTK